MFLFLFLLQTDDRSESNQAITFTTHRTLSNASTIAPEFKEDEEEEEEEEYFMGDPYMEEGLSFRLGSVSKVTLFFFVLFSFSPTFFFFFILLILFFFAQSVCTLPFLRSNFPIFFPPKEDDIRDPKNPDSFPWCLMNLCITKLVQEGVRKILTTAGLEVLGTYVRTPSPTKF